MGLACQLASDLDLPLSRMSREDLRRVVIEQGIVAQISGSTIWRWLDEHAIRPWSHRSWVFPRDPDFSWKAGRVLDLYGGLWEDEFLGPRDYVLCADEKTGIQIRRRIHPTHPPRPGQPMRVEHEYERLGTVAYLAAWDVHRARLFGQVERKSDIPAFGRLVDQFMSQEPYRSAGRVFLIVDNGTIHRGHRAVDRLRECWANLFLIHLPVHASWLNQMEIYFSIVKRKVLTPDDFASREDLEDRLLRFQDYYQKIAAPFAWTFTRSDLNRLMAKLAGVPRALRPAA